MGGSSASGSPDSSEDDIDDIDDIDDDVQESAAHAAQMSAEEQEGADEDHTVPPLRRLRLSSTGIILHGGENSPGGTTLVAAGEPASEPSSGTASDTPPSTPPHKRTLGGNMLKFKFAAKSVMASKVAKEDSIDTLRTGEKISWCCCSVSSR